ncbi:MAG: tetratricopeptide repeat protein [Spirochaetales bacterium]|nr:MAG: tetratricopeptide repeat protein [Spirochaetales bacterium]
MNGPARNRILRSSLLCAALACTTFPAVGQTGADNLDEYYRFPFSVGAGYRSLQGLSGFASVFTISEVGAELRAPLPFAPTLQPLLAAGTVSWLEAGSTGTGQFDHNEWFASLGLAFSTRFTRNFELGVEGSGGLTQAYYQNLSPGSAVGDLGVIADAAIRIGLIPSYNVSVDVRPGMRWARTLGTLDEFDGLSFGLGFSISYRFGQDPDSATALIRALKLSTGKLPPVFSAMQSYYSTKPFATIMLSNEEKSDISDIEISFFQPGYMDAPTPVATLDSIPAKGSVNVGLLAAFNQEVFRTEGATPLAGELTVRYRYRGRPVEQRFPLSYDLLDRTAIVWDDDRKVGAFITPADSALRNYASYIRQNLSAEILPQLNGPLQTAAQIYTALGSLGLIYQADPSSPFVTVQADTLALDSVSLGRSTLVRGTGDCDDLTVLYASLLESVGIETGFITVPGHIYPAFNTKLAARDYRDLYPDRSMTVVLNDELWIPIEITMVGRQTFLEAWRKGAELWRLYETDATKRAFNRTADAQATYRPVALRESDLGLQYGSKGDLTAVYRREFTTLSDSALSDLAAATAKSGDKKDWNNLGMAYARYGRLKDAETSFQRALRIDPAFTSSQVNLGNLAYMQKNYRKAINAYQAATKTLESQGKGSSLSAQMVFVNISMAYNALSDFNGARGAYEKAASINPERVRDFSYLASVGASTSESGRAAEQSDRILFLSDE